VHVTVSFSLNKPKLFSCLNFCVALFGAPRQGFIQKLTCGVVNHREGGEALAGPKPETQKAESGYRVLLRGMAVSPLPTS